MNQRSTLQFNLWRPISWLALMLLLVSSAAQAQTTAFTYQGRLTDNTLPANGSYDFQFKLFDALAAGAQVGGTLSPTNVAVANGIFTVTLDFGAPVFPGANRWLDISVRLAGGGAFTPLTPRQPITSTPYAIKALSAEGLAATCVGCITGAQIGSLPANSGNYIQNGAALQAGANFNISGNGTAGGTLSANIVNATTQFNIGGQRVLSVAGTDNLFAGRSTGAANTSGTQNTFVGHTAGDVNTSGTRNTFIGEDSGGANTTGSENTFVGEDTGAANSSGSSNVFIGKTSGNTNTTGSSNTVVGHNADVRTGNLTNATALGANASVDQSNSLVLGQFNGNGNGGTANTMVGIGTNKPNGLLEVVNDNLNPADTFLITQHSTGGGGAAITFRQSRGTRATPAASGNGDNLFFMTAAGHNGTNFTSGRARFLAETTEAWTAAANGTRFTFFTTPNGSTTPVERMRMDHNGNLGIGTGNTTPVARLHVVDGANTSGTIQIGGTDTWSAGERRRVLFGDGGLVYVGEEDADDRLVLRGRLGVRFKANAGQLVAPDADNDLSLGDATHRWTAVWAVDGTINTSDARMKKGITNLNYGLSQIMQLRPVSFQWKDRKDGQLNLGLIAQEVAEVIPEAVVKAKDEATTMGLNYSSLVPVLIKAVQEQQTTLERKDAELKAVKAENDALNTRLAAIEQLLQQQLKEQAEKQTKQQ